MVETVEEEEEQAEADTPKKFMPANDDVIFKLFFGDERNKEFLIGFLTSVLNLPINEYTDIEISDPHLKREHTEDKLSILDVKVKTNTGKWINIEIQVSVNVPQEMRARIFYYTTKMTAGQLKKGGRYRSIKRVISIVITGEILIPEHNEYHDMFIVNSPKTRVRFTDLLEIYTLELPKLPKETDGSDLYDWLGFIKASNEEELAMLAERSPQMKAPIEKLIELNQDEEARMLFEAREKERRDMMEREEWAREEGELNKAFEIARKMLAKDKPIDEIIDFTGLSYEEIRELSIAN